MKIAGGIMLALGMLGVIISIVVGVSSANSMVEGMTTKPVVVKETKVSLGQEARLEGVTIAIEQNKPILYYATLKVVVEPKGASFSYPYEMSVVDDNGKSIAMTSGTLTDTDYLIWVDGTESQPAASEQEHGIRIPVVDQTANQQQNFRTFQAVATAKIEPKPAMGGDAPDPDAPTLKSAQFLIESKEIPMAAAMGAGLGMIGGCIGVMLALVGLILLIIGLVTGKKQ